MWCDMEQLKAAKMQMMPVSMYTQPTYGSWNPYGGAQTAMLIPGPPANMQGCSCARKTSCDCKKRKKKKKKKKSKSDSDDESVHYYMRRSEPRYDGCEWSSIFIRSFAGSDSEKMGEGRVSWPCSRCCLLLLFNLSLFYSFELSRYFVR